MAKEIYLSVDGKQVALTNDQLKVLGLYEEENSPFNRIKTDKKYYYISSTGETLQSYEGGDYYDEERYKAANYCSDRNLMHQRTLHETLNRLLWRFSMENDGDKIDWHNNRTDKWFIYYDNHNLCLDVYACSHGNRIGAIHFNSKEIAQRAINEIIIPFMEKHPDFIW